MHVHLRVRNEERRDGFGLVHRQVVGNDVDFLAARLIGDQIGEQQDQARVAGHIGPPVAGTGLALEFNSLARLVSSWPSPDGHDVPI